MISSLEGWPTKAKEAPSLHDVRMTLLDTTPVFLCLKFTSVCDPNESQARHHRILLYLESHCAGTGITTLF